MLWNKKYILKSYIKSSLWLVPFFAIVLYWVVSRMTHWLGGWLHDTGRIDEATAFHGLTMAGARSLLDIVITSNLSFLVFTFGSLLVAIQVAGGQYTPRIIATLLRDNKIRLTVGYFVFTLLFAVRALARMGEELVHQLNVFIAGSLGLISVVVFLYLIDYAARFLRPISLVKRVGEAGLTVIDDIYPEKEAPQALSGALSAEGSFPGRTVVHVGTSGVVLAVDVAGLSEQARRHDGVIEFLPQVGDFVAAGEPLFRLAGGAARIDDRILRGAVAFGTERTIEQDPTFAFRILVDIAIKALSPAINDPTTAVLAIDQLHRLLRRAGLRPIKGDAVLDAAGKLRVVFRLPHWEDFVHLACTEIRHYGSGNIQVARRLRSMLENLVQTLPPYRHFMLIKQLEYLDREINEHYPFSEDRNMARIPDPQGLGGTLGVNVGPEGESAQAD